MNVRHDIVNGTGSWQMRTFLDCKEAPRKGPALPGHSSMLSAHLLDDETLTNERMRSRLAAMRLRDVLGGRSAG